MPSSNPHPQIPAPALPPRPGSEQAAPATPEQPAQMPYGSESVSEQISTPEGSYSASYNASFNPNSAAYANAGTGANIPPSIPADGTVPSAGAPQQPGPGTMYAPPVLIVHQQPAYQLKTNRSLLKYIPLGIITLGIYDIVVMYGVTEDTNAVASPHDGRKSMNYLLMYFLFGWLSLGIAWLVWYSNLSDRIGNELQRRGLPREVSMADFWLWNILGALIIVGPFIYMYKLLKATNMMCADYNARG